VLFRTLAQSCTIVQKAISMAMKVFFSLCCLGYVPLLWFHVKRPSSHPEAKDKGVLLREKASWCGGLQGMGGNVSRETRVETKHLQREGSFCGRGVPCNYQEYRDCFT
jgi:hypothetical protein